MGNVRDSIKEIIDDIIGDSYDCEINQLSSADIDSLDMVQIVMDIEDRFNIEISDDEGAGCKMFQDLVDLVERKVREG